MGKTVILSTHIVSDIEDSCYRLSVLDHGTILYSGGLQGLIDVSAGKVWEKTLPQACCFYVAPRSPPRRRVAVWTWSQGIACVPTSQGATPMRQCVRVQL